jgi:hypothetical protein
MQRAQIEIAAITEQCIFICVSPDSYLAELLDAQLLQICNAFKEYLSENRVPGDRVGGFFLDPALAVRPLLLLFVRES